MRPSILTFDVPHVPAGFVGRERELRAVAALFRGVGERGAALLLRGGVGVGKSALLAVASERAEAAGMSVLTVLGARPEARVPFAGLHQLLKPLLDRAESLARPQRDALLETFGMDPAVRPDRFLVALAALELLAEQARKAPLLVAVDNAHWLDPPSAEVFGFLARRLTSEPVVLLVAVRDGFETTFGEFGLPELHVHALNDQSSRALLESRFPALSAELGTQVLMAAAGNPLALVELAGASGSHQPVGFGVPILLPITARLEQAFVESFQQLPAPTRQLLLIASVDRESSPNEVLSAAALQPEDGPAGLDDLAPAVASGLVKHDATHISFHHPMLAAAIYQTATTAQRHRAHRALASALIDHPQRRAWHRAASATSPDEEVAAELERAWAGATSLGTTDVTLAALERAADLTPDTSRRCRRLLGAAELAVELGHLDWASKLIASIDPAGCETPDRTRIGLVRSLIEPGLAASGKAVDSLVEVATRAASVGEIERALRLLQAAATHSWWSDPDRGICCAVAAAVHRVPAPDSEPLVLSILATCDPGGLGETLGDIASDTAPDACDPHTAYSLGTALHTTGAFEDSTVFLTAAAAGLRQQGRRWLLPQALAQRSWNAISTGNWDVATAAAEEATTLARDTRQPMWEAAAKTALSMIAGIRGDDACAESLLREAESIALPLGARAVLADIQLARAFVALGRARYDEAFHHLERTFQPHDPAHHPVRSFWRIGEYAEASLRAGQVDHARDQLARLEGASELASSTPVQVGLLYARPLLADEESAEAQFQVALAANLTRWPLYRARLLLEYGTWLRHRRKIAAARTPLRTARDAFDALGALPWAERARRELRASRETQHGQPEAWFQLTQQEQQIAQLAAQGLSNREIAERLYMSHRTVGCHLYRIFPKLGISSRTQLSAVIAGHSVTGLAS